MYLDARYIMYLDARYIMYLDARYSMYLDASHRIHLDAQHAFRFPECVACHQVWFVHDNPNELQSVLHVIKSGLSMITLMNPTLSQRAHMHSVYEEGTQ